MPPEGVGFIEGGVILFVVLDAMVFIWGTLVVIMEPEGVLFIEELSWAWMASGRAKARKAKDGLTSLVMFFIGVYFCVGSLVDKVIGGKGGSQPPVACNGCSCPLCVTQTARASRPVIFFGWSSMINVP